MERSIVIGSLLGDGSINKNPGPRGNARVRFCQGVEQSAYLEWKYCQLKRWVLSPPTAPYPTGYDGMVSAFSTISHPVFTELWHLIYPVHRKKKQKRILDALIEQLDDLALAVWFMDDGGSQKYMAKLSTYSFLPQDLLRVTSFLCQREMFCRVYQDGNKGPIILFTSGGAKNLMDVIAPLMHPIFAYKSDLSANKGGKLHPNLPKIFGKKKESICPYCGEHFVAKKSQTICGKRKCYRANMNKLQKAWRRKHQRMETVRGICVICGKPFQAERIELSIQPAKRHYPKTCSRQCRAILIQKRRHGFTV